MPACSVAAPSRGELVDDVVATVDVKRLASDEALRIVREERGGDADIVDPDQAAGRSLRFRLVEQLEARSLVATPSSKPWARRREGRNLFFDWSNCRELPIRV